MTYHYRTVRATPATLNKPYNIGIGLIKDPPKYPRRDPFLGLQAEFLAKRALASQETTTSNELSQPWSPQLSTGILNQHGSLPTAVPNQLSDAAAVEQAWKMYTKYHTVTSLTQSDHPYYQNLLGQLVRYYRGHHRHTMDPPSNYPAVRAQRAARRQIMANRIYVLCNHWIIRSIRSHQAYLETLSPVQREDPHYQLLALPSRQDLQMITQALCLAQKPSAVLEVLEQMREWYQCPTAEAVTPLLTYFWQQGQTDELRHLVQQMREWKLDHTEDTIHPVLLAVAEANDLDNLQKVVTQCHSEHFAIPTRTFTAVAQVFAKRNNADAVHYLYRLLIYRYHLLYESDLETWYQVFERVHRVDLGVALYHRMVFYQTSFTLPMFTHLIPPLVFAERYNTVADMFDHFVGCKLGYTPLILAAFLLVHTRTHRLSLARTLFAKVQQQFITVSDRVAIHWVVESLLASNQLAEAVAFIQNKVPGKVSPYLNTYTLLLDYATQSHQGVLLQSLRSDIRVRSLDHSTHPQLSGVNLSTLAYK
ncbi:hypothetical protein IWQ62_001569 [Dispira parvispora]|uniref:Uncharacterized protein n=1 Tax=Dispira parvispora TaxID=1520584 RepID=A0A9W8E8X3_9FUNG|nr:hypothetical protein IWQ62_001569 [Dispira parvispora]